MNWQLSKAIAQVTLGDRKRRRQFMSGVLAGILVLFSLGVWVLDVWLAKGLWRFLFYWGGTAFFCLFLVLMAVFDALAVIGEERSKLGLDKPPTEDSDPS